MLVGRQLAEAIAVGVDKQPVPGAGHAYIISPHQSVVFLEVVGYQHVDVVKLTSFCLVDGRYDNVSTRHVAKVFD